MDDTYELDLVETSPPRPNFKIVGNKVIYGYCITDSYIDISKPVCQNQQFKNILRMTEPLFEKPRDKNRYRPHQGAKEMARRKRQMEKLH